MWPLRRMWLYEAFPSPLCIPTNLLHCGPRIIFPGARWSSHGWMNECASLCACMLVYLLRMCLHPCVQSSLHFKPNHRTHWPVSQFGQFESSGLCALCADDSTAAEKVSWPLSQFITYLSAWWCPGHKALTDLSVRVATVVKVIHKRWNDENVQ